MTIITNQFVSIINLFIKTNFRRPTNLSAMQQQLALDTQVKVNIKEQLEEELEKEEIELEEMMAKALKNREKFHELKEKEAKLREQLEKMLGQVDLSGKVKFNRG